MSDSLDQIQLNFVPNEDRLLLKLRGGDKLYRAWVTRRYLKRLILKPARGQGIVLPYTPEVNHMLLKLIYQVLPSTQWALEEEILSPMHQALQ